MAKIFVVMGKSASGKDTIFKQLAKDAELALKTVVIYTTRPIRSGEKEGVEYHFVNDEKLHQLQEEGKVIECRSYDTVYGVWNYFTVADEQINLDTSNYILIGTLESFTQIQKYYGAKIVKPIYITVDDGERLQRALNREREQSTPKYEEMCRRFLADQKDFSEDKIKACGIEKCFENQMLEECLQQVKCYINQEIDML